MWAARRRKRIIRNICLAILSIVIAAGLFIALSMAQKKTDEYHLTLSQEYSKQQTEQTNAKQSLVNRIEADYQRDMDTVSEYLPGIVCWGDTLTAGSSGTISYPYILKKYIETYICDIYDFMSSVENADEFSFLDWDKYKVDIPVINMGVANEDTNTVLGRSGVIPYVIAEDVTIPSEVKPVEIKILSQNGKAVTPLSGGNGGVNSVTINGIKGTLILDSLDSNESFRWNNIPSYSFTRLEEGEEIPVEKGTPIITAASDMYKDYIHIVCIGTCGGYETANELTEQIRLLLSRQTSNTDRYLVLGICYDRGWKNMSKFDTAFVQAFGERYINIRDYLCSDGMVDAGLTLTNEEKQEVAAGIVPGRLRSSSGGPGLSARAYKLIGKIVYERMDQLGYFDEVKTELNIVESQKKAIKDDPDYFSSIIRNW